MAGAGSDSINGGKMIGSLGGIGRAGSDLLIGRGAVWAILLGILGAGNAGAGAAPSKCGRAMGVARNDPTICTYPATAQYRLSDTNSPVRGSANLRSKFPNNFAPKVNSTNIGGMLGFAKKLLGKNADK